MFWALLYCWQRDESSRSLLAILCVYCRDAILRDSAKFILNTPVGQLITREDTEAYFDKKFPVRFSPVTLKSLAQSINGTWTRAGHLAGKLKKVRSKPEVADMPVGTRCTPKPNKALLVAGLIRAQDEQGKPVEPRELECKAIGKTQYRVETTTITAKPRIEIRKVLQIIGVSAKIGEELLQVPLFLDKLKALALSADGEAPKPSTPEIAFIDQIHISVGNEQLLQIFTRKDELQQAIEDWGILAKRIDELWPAWLQLKELARQADGLPHAETYRL